MVRKFMLLLVVSMCPIGLQAKELRISAFEPRATPEVALPPFESKLRNLGITPDAAGLIGYLRMRKAAESQNVSEFIKQLGDSSWRVREAATLKLQNMPNPPIKALIEAAKSDDLEVSARAKMILQKAKHHTDTLLLVLLALEYKSVPAAKYKHILRVVPEILQSYSFLTPTYTHARVAAMLEACSLPEDAPLLRAALKNKDPLLRAAASGALGAAIGKKAADDLLGMQKDPDENVRLTAATALGVFQDRRCLKALGKLLTANSVDTRAAAADTLFRLTGKPFAFDAWESFGTSAKQVAAWRGWIDKNANSVQLKPLVPRKLRNVALLKHVSSGVPESKDCLAKGYYANRLTNGIYQGVDLPAYPGPPTKGGQFCIDYMIDLCKTTKGTNLANLKKKGFHITHLVIDWGHYGGRKSKRGKLLQFIHGYSISYRTATTPAGKWHKIHSCKVAPVDEKTKLKDTPLVLDYTSNKNITLITGINLRNVISLRLEAKSRANWIGAFELEARGWPE